MQIVPMAFCAEEGILHRRNPRKRSISPAKIGILIAMETCLIGRILLVVHGSTKRASQAEEGGTTFVLLYLVY
jgi:hypothetical protein